MYSDNLFCVYFTSYSGNKIPPFYIGSTSVDKILGDKKYRGSVASKKFAPIWKSEQRENPHLFKTIILSIHNTRDEAYTAEDKLLRLRDCVNSPLYLNARCAKGLGYHPKGELSPRFGVKHSAETKAIISKIHKGKILSDKHKRQISIANTNKIVSAKTRAKASASAKLRETFSEETRAKMSHAKKGKKQNPEHIAYNTSLKIGCKWWNNGISQIYNRTCPEGWIHGRLTMKGKSTKGKRWWNNGVTRCLTEICPGPTWILGKQIT